MSRAAVFVIVVLDSALVFGAALVLVGTAFGRLIVQVVVPASRGGGVQRVGRGAGVPSIPL
jgi:hypothetical protein